MSHDEEDIRDAEGWRPRPFAQVSPRKAKFRLEPLRRLAAEPRIPERGHHKGWWPESFNWSGLLGPFSESRCLDRRAEVAAQRARAFK